MGAYLDQRQPDDEIREPLLRSPAVVNAFIVVFVVIHIVTQYLSDDAFNLVLLNFAMIPEHLSVSVEALAVPLILDPAFTLVTYAFLHGDFEHLAFNSMWFLIFGTAVARRVGLLRFLALFLVTAVAAAATHLWFHWGSPLPVVGVSGVVSGFMGATFRFILPNPKPVDTWPPPALPLFSRPVLLITAVWSALNIMLGVSGFTPEGFGAAIAWEAHMGGYFAGLVLFPLFDQRRRWLR